MRDPGAAGLVAGRAPRLRLLGVAGGVALVANAGWELGQRPLYATESRSCAACRRRSSTPATPSPPSLPRGWRPPASARGDDGRHKKDDAPNAQGGSLHDLRDEQRRLSDHIARLEAQQVPEPQLEAAARP